ncbi:hypothetical protein DGG96_19115 [Legionella qingyii]|uniref:Uncharacterized protein n=1 Tax=Legionella qingyii TaxID=2184757 RepID=A0A317TX59_9GAMM|nr:hypothetical protein DGG96_19115 [Legionella qingyii]
MEDEVYFSNNLKDFFLVIRERVLSLPINYDQEVDYKINVVKQVGIDRELKVDLSHLRYLTLRCKVYSVTNLNKRDEIEIFMLEPVDSKAVEVG